MKSLAKTLVWFGVIVLLFTFIESIDKGCTWTVAIDGKPHTFSVTKGISKDGGTP
jgi:hypothetical protein